MDFMKLDVSSWNARGNIVGLAPYLVDDDLLAANQAIVAADDAVGGLWHMSGVGYPDRSESAQKVCDDLTELYTYIAALPNDIVDRIGEPFFEALDDGPVQALSKIDMDNFTTANTCGVTEPETIVSGSGEDDVTISVLKGAIGFSDFMDGDAMPDFDPIHRVPGGGPTLIGPDDGGSIPGFADIFKDDYESWRAEHPDEDVDFATYTQEVIDAVEFDHEAYHPVKSVVSDLVTMVPGVNLVFAIADAITGTDVITGEDMKGWQIALNLAMSGIDVVGLGLAGVTAGGSLVGADALDEAAKAALRQGIKDALVKELIATSVSGVVSGLSYDAAIDLGFPPKVATLISLGLGVAVNVAGTTYVVKNAAGKVIAEIPAQTTGITVNQVTRSGIPGLWDRLVHSPFDRGSLIDKLLGNNMGYNYPMIDRFESATGEAISIKSLDTGAKSYQTTASLENKVDTYVDDVASSNGSTVKGTGTGPTYVTQSMVKSRILELAIPDRQLSQAQKEALDNVKAYAKSKNVSVVIVVVQ